MGKPERICLLVLLCAVFLFTGGLPGAADSTMEETKKLLQKSLTLAELDQEIARLTGQEKNIGDDILQTEGLIAENQAKVGDTRQHAGKVLRAYYMGERDHMWMLLLSAKSLSEALAIVQYFNMIIENDHHALNAYANSYKDLVEAKNKLEADKAELQEVMSAFVAQREKVIAVQKEIDEQLKASADAEALRKEMNRFTEEWKEKGLPLFRKYLAAISGAMQGLPELLEGKNAEKYLKFDGLGLTSAAFTIRDTEITEFFRSKDPVFNNIRFRFEDGKFIASGGEDSIQVEIEGHYTVENDPNRLQFHVDRLSYNGLMLPETSNRALEDEFDMGFTPSKYVKNLKVNEVTLQGGMLSLKIKL